MKTIISMFAATAATVSLAAAAPALTERVEEIVSSGEAPAAVLTIWKNDSPVFEAAAGCARLRAGGDCLAPMTLETKFRVASISKMAAAFAAISMARDGLVDLDADISAYDGTPLRNPAYPGRAMTLRHVLSHTSTIRDPSAYWVAAPGDLSSILADPDIFAPNDGAPGEYFTYANLNFGLAAGMLERAGGKRFDEIFSARVAEPLGLDIGFNWSGVSRKARRNGATLYRKADGVWTPQTDGQEILEMRGPFFLAEEGLDRDDYLAAYEPGANPTLFSPQGGLRASVRDLARLVSLLRPGAMFEEAASWQWRHENDNGDTLGQLMLAYGLGVHEAPAPGREALLIGHSGEAYGLFSGAWIVRGTPYIIAYAVTGSTLPDAPGEIPGFTDVEINLLNIAFDAISLDDAQDDFMAQQEALLAEARAALAADPDNADAAIWAGRRLGYLGRYDEAIATYTEAWAKHPDDARFPRHIGHRLISQRRYAEAVEMFKKAAALVAAKPDAVEPDGLPNAAGVPTSTLKGNIWYHLGLAHYLQGQFAAASRAYEGAAALAHNPDAAAAARYWLYLSLFRAGDRGAAQSALDAVEADWTLIENHIYHELTLCLRGDADCEAIMERARAEEGIGFATPAYGVAMAAYVKGDKKAAQNILKEIVARGPSVAFGHLAAEADLETGFHAQP